MTSCYNLCNAYKTNRFNSMTQTKRLVVVLGLNIAMVAGLVIVGLSSHSLGVLAAGSDYIADSTAIGLGLIAIYVRDRSKGRSKATTIVAAINATFLLVVTAIVSVEALRRLLSHSPEIHGLSVLIVSAIATVVMVIGALVLASDDQENDLHMRSVILDTVSDSISAGAVAATGAIIFFAKGLYWLDSAVALVIGLVVAYQAIKLLRDVLINLKTK